MNDENRKAMYAKRRFPKSKSMRLNKKYFIEDLIPTSKYLKLTRSDTANWNKKSLENLENRISKNKPIDVPLLVIDVNKNVVLNHDGRHRAKVALQKGIKKIPVIIAPIDTSHRTHYLIARNELTPEQINIIDQHNFKPQTKNFITV